MLVDHAFHAQLAGAKSNPFFDEVDKIDRQIEELRLGIGRVAQRSVDTEGEIYKLAAIFGMPIENVPKQG